MVSSALLVRDLSLLAFEIDVIELLLECFKFMVCDVVVSMMQRLCCCGEQEKDFFNGLSCCCVVF